MCSRGNANRFAFTEFELPVGARDTDLGADSPGTLAGDGVPVHRRDIGSRKITQGDERLRERCSETVGEGGPVW